MAIQDNGTRNQYTATAAQTVFPYTFEIFTAGDITVEQNSSVITAYTVSGVGNDGGGNITLDTGATAGDIITIYRSMALERLSDYQQNGEFTADEINTDLDRLWAGLQQSTADTSLAVRSNTSDPIFNSSNTLLASPSVRSGKSLGFDSTGLLEYQSVSMPDGDVKYTTLTPMANDNEAEIGTSIYILSDRADGVFDCVSSASVTINNYNVIPSAVDGNKAFVLRVNGITDAKQWGISAGASDISSAFQAMQDFGVAAEMEAGTYTIENPVEFKVSTKAYGGRVVFNASSLPANSTAVTCNNESDVIGFDIDCANTTTMKTGYQHALEFTPTRRTVLDVLVKNVTNTDNTQPAQGCVLVVGTLAANSNVKIKARLEAHNITATANSVIGDNGGAATGILTSINKSGVTVDMILDEPRASNIYPDEDGDGIITFDADLSNLASQSTYVINNPKAWDCAKRGVKTQTPNTTINNMFVDLDLNSGTEGGALSYESLGVNTTLNNPRINGTSNLTGDGSILASAANFTCNNPFIDVAAGQNLLRFGTGATNHKVHGGLIKSTKSYGSNAFSMITVEGAASGSIELDSVQVTSKTASVIRYQGASASHNFKVKDLAQAETLFNIAFSATTADLHLWAYNVDCADKIIDNLGANGSHTVHAIYGETDGSTAATCESAMRFIGDGNITSTTNGILYTGAGNAGREVSGEWKYNASSGVSVGIGIDAGGSQTSKFTGIETSGFAAGGIHLNLNFSDKCVTTNNIARGLGTHVSATGATNLINRDNDLIP